MNKKMRVFPKDMQDYEPVLTSDKYLRRFRMERVIKPQGFTDLTEYKNTMRQFLKESSICIWDMSVKMEWLSRKFKYRGKSGTSPLPIGVQSKTAFSVFTKEFVGINSHFASYSFCSRNIKEYFSELYPNFKTDNPFKNPEKFKYPFSHVTIDFLLFVYQIPERMDLLMVAEKSKMNFTKFVDYIINYIGKFNDSEDKQVFEVRKPKNFPMYVKYLG